MQVTVPGPTREKRAVAEWLDQSAKARAQLAAAIGDEVPSTLACFDVWSIAAASLGECELHARALDRAQALKVFPERRALYEAAVTDRNDAGIALLEQLRETQLPEFKSELARLELKPEHLDATLSNLERSFAENLADFEMSGSDARKLLRALREGTDSVRDAGPAGLGKHLEKTLDDLVEARRDSDRGVRENIPWWKWLTLAGIFGWFLVGTIVAAALSGRDPKAAAIIYGISMAMVIAGWVCLMLFC